MRKSNEFINKVDWVSLEADFEAVDMYDDWQVSKKEFEKNKESMSKTDLAILEPLYKEMNASWEMFSKAEQLNSIVANLVTKYMNTYTFPQPGM
jgi:hypothetical protein